MRSRTSAAGPSCPKLRFTKIQWEAAELVDGIEPCDVHITLEISSPGTGVATLPLQALAEGSH